MSSFQCKLTISYLLLSLPMMCFAQIFDHEMMMPTSTIGTAEQPTIEGGIINTPHNKKENGLPHFFDVSDEFSHDENIKSLLNTAAKDGKLAYVLQRAEQLKLPATVALIPLVESHYRTDAVSPKGATGAWQLMPNTASDYGLDNKSRTNFMASTNTALHLLSDLHQQFGNWTLAFAAYNAGSTRVKQAFVHHSTVQEIEALDLPWETTRYVQRLKRLYHAITKLSADNLNHPMTY